MGLVCLIAFAAYMLWPPSTDYLYRHAKAGMASEELVDWKRADEEYISKLVSRFPGRHDKEIAAGADRIAVEDARVRSLNINRSLRKPRRQVEERYQEINSQAADETKAGRDLVAGRSFGETWRHRSRTIGRHGGGIFYSRNTPTTSTAPCAVERAEVFESLESRRLPSNTPARSPRRSICAMV